MSFSVLSSTKMLVLATIAALLLFVEATPQSKNGYAGNRHNRIDAGGGSSELGASSSGNSLPQYRVFNEEDSAPFIGGQPFGLLPARESVWRPKSRKSRPNTRGGSRSVFERRAQALASFDPRIDGPNFNYQGPTYDDSAASDPLNHLDYFQSVVNSFVPDFLCTEDKYISYKKTCPQDMIALAYAKTQLADRISSYNVDAVAAISLSGYNVSALRESDYYECVSSCAHGLTYSSDAPYGFSRECYIPPESPYACPLRHTSCPPYSEYNLTTKLCDCVYPHTLVNVTSNSCRCPLGQRDTETMYCANIVCPASKYLDGDDCKSRCPPHSVFNAGTCICSVADGYVSIPSNPLNSSKTWEHVCSPQPVCVNNYKYVDPIGCVCSGVAAADGTCALDSECVVLGGSGSPSNCTWATIPSTVNANLATAVTDIVNFGLDETSSQQVYTYTLPFSPSSGAILSVTPIVSAVYTSNSNPVPSDMLPVRFLASSYTMTGSTISLVFNVINNPEITGDMTVTIGHKLVVSSGRDIRYSFVSGANPSLGSFSFVVRDKSSATIIVSPIEWTRSATPMSLSTLPGQDSVTFAVALGATWASPLLNGTTGSATLHLTSSDPRIILTPSSLAFNSGNTAIPRTVSVSWDPNFPASVEVPFNITQSISGISLFSSTQNKIYGIASGLEIPTLTRTSPPATLAEGSSVTYTVMLGKRAAADPVSLTIGYSILGEISSELSAYLPQVVKITPSVISLDSSNVNTNVTITVSYENDEVVAGAHSILLHHTVISSDPLFGTLSLPSITIDTTDNDAPELLVTLDATVEEGNAITGSLSLSKKPLYPVHVWTSSNSSRLLLPANITFSGSNYSTAVPVSVATINDAVAVDDENVSVNFFSLGFRYASAPSVQRSVLLTDTQDRLAAGVLLQPSGYAFVNGTFNALASQAGEVVLSSLPVNLRGFVEFDTLPSTGRFSVRLATQPVGTVAVHLSADSQLELLSRPGPLVAFTRSQTFSLLFGPGNWSTPVTVLVTAFDDSIAEGTHWGKVQASTEGSSLDRVYNGRTALLTVDVLDNDVAGLEVVPAPLFNATSQLPTTAQAGSPAAALPGLWLSEQAVSIQSIPSLRYPALASLTQLASLTPSGLLHVRLRSQPFNAALTDLHSLSATFNNRNPSVVDVVVAAAPAGSCATNGVVSETPNACSTDADCASTANLYFPKLTTAQVSRTCVFSPLSTSSSLTFSGSSWSTFQSFTVTASNDSRDSRGPLTRFNRYALNVSATGAAAFSVLPAQRVVVPVYEDDAATLTLAGLTTLAEGASGTLTVTVGASFDGSLTVSFPETQLPQSALEPLAPITFTSNSLSSSVTVKSRDNFIVDGSRSVVLTPTISTTDVFLAAVRASTAITVTDNDVAGIDVGIVGARPTGHYNFARVTLRAQPLYPLTITFRSSSGAVFFAPTNSLQPGSAAFQASLLSVYSVLVSPKNWRLPVLVGLSGDVDISFTVSVGFSGQLDPAWASVAVVSSSAPRTVSSVTYLLGTGVTRMEEGQSLTLLSSSSGSATSYLAELNTCGGLSEPRTCSASSDCPRSHSCAATGVRLSNPQVLDFIASFTLTAPTDGLTDGTDAALYEVDGLQLAVLVQDADGPGLVLPAPAALAVTEGASVSFSVALRSTPLEAVTVRLRSDDAHVSFSPSSLSLTSTTSSSVQMSVAIDGKYRTRFNNYSIPIYFDATSADASYDLGSSSVQAVVQEADSRAVTVLLLDVPLTSAGPLPAPTSPFTLTEGGFRRISIALGSVPVTGSLLVRAAANASIFTVAGRAVSTMDMTLTGTTPFTFDLAVADDSLYSAPYGVSLSLSAPATTANLANEAFASFSVSSAITVVDNDVPSIGVLPSSELLVLEGAAAAEFNVSVGTLPAPGTRIAFTLSLPSIASFSSRVIVTVGTSSLPVTLPYELVFSSTSSRTQTVRLQAVEDRVAFSEAAGTLSIALASSSTSLGYGAGAFAPLSVSVRVRDNDTPALLVSPSSITLLNGTSFQGSLRAATQPQSPLTVEIGAAAANVSSAVQSFVLTSSNFETGTLLSFTASLPASSAASPLIQTRQIVYSAAGHSSVSQTVEIVNPNAGLTFSSSNSTLREGHWALFSVLLSTQPMADVQLTFSLTPVGSPGSRVTLTGLRHTVSRANWTTPVTANLTFLDDLVAATGEQYSVCVSSASSATYYHRLSRCVVVSLVDNDVAQLTVRVVSGASFNATSGIYTFTEGTAAVLAVQPGSQLIGQLSVALVSDAGAVITASPPVAAFQPGSFTAINFFVTPVDNNVMNPTRSGLLTLTATPLKAQGGSDGAPDTAYTDLRVLLPYQVLDDDASKIGVLLTPSVSLQDTLGRIQEGQNATVSVALPVNPGGHARVRVLLSPAAALGITVTPSDFNFSFLQPGPFTATVHATHDFVKLPTSATSRAGLLTARVLSVVDAPLFQNLSTSLSLTVLESDSAGLRLLDGAGTTGAALGAEAVRVSEGQSYLFTLKPLSLPSSATTLRVYVAAAADYTPEAGDATLSLHAYQGRAGGFVPSFDNAVPAAVPLGSVTGLGSSSANFLDVPLNADAFQNGIVFQVTALTDAVTDPGRYVVWLSSTAVAPHEFSALSLQLPIETSESGHRFSVARLNLAEGPLPAVATVSAELFPAPTVDVPSTLSLGTADARVSFTPTSFTFSPANPVFVFNVTVTDDALYNPSGLVQLLLTSGSFSSPLYLDIVDNDVPGVSVYTSQSRFISMAEGSSGPHVQVRLLARPTAPVQVSLTELPQSVGALPLLRSVAPITVLPENWALEHNITIEAIRDFVVQPQLSTRLQASLSSADPNFSTSGEYLRPAQLIVNVTNIDSAGITLGSTTLKRVTEGAVAGTVGAADTVTLVLNSRPLSPVVIRPVPGARLIVSPSLVTFTGANWNVPQSVAFSAVDDRLAEEPQHTEALAFVVDESTVEAAYRILTIPSVSVTITDNDVVGVLVSSSQLTVLEGPTARGAPAGAGSSASYHVTLASRPFLSFIDNGNPEVTVSLHATDGFCVASSGQPVFSSLCSVATDCPDAHTCYRNSSFTFSPSTLTFNGLNWNIPQTVTVHAIQDLSIEPDSLTFQLRHSAASESDRAYNLARGAPVAVNVLDDDVAVATYVYPAPGAQALVLLDEAATAPAQVTVSLNVRPWGSVSLSAVPGSSQFSSSGAVTFVPGNFSLRTLLLRALDDAVDEPKPHADSVSFTATATLAADTSIASALARSSIPVSIMDNDFAGLDVKPVRARRSDGALVRGSAAACRSCTTAAACAAAGCSQYYGLGTEFVVEERGSELFSFSLRSRPTSPVTITLHSVLRDASSFPEVRLDCADVPDSGPAYPFVLGASLGSVELSDKGEVKNLTLEARFDGRAEGAHTLEIALALSSSDLNYQSITLLGNYSRSLSQRLATSASVRHPGLEAALTAYSALIGASTVGYAATPVAPVRVTVAENRVSPPPSLQSARYRSDSTVLLTFDGPVANVANVLCHTILQLTTEATENRCSASLQLDSAQNQALWGSARCSRSATTARTLVAVLAADSQLTAAHRVFPRELKDAFQTSFATGQQLLSFTDFPAPQLSLSSPSRVSPCDGFTVASSVTYAGRNPTYVWSVVVMDNGAVVSSTPVHDVVDAANTANAASVSIPRTATSAGFSYTFELSVTSSLSSLSSTASATTTVAVSSVPALSHPNVDLEYGANLVISPLAIPAFCEGDTPDYSVPIETYIFDTTLVGFPALDASLMGSALVSPVFSLPVAGALPLAKEPAARSLTIPSSQLVPGATYSFTVFALRQGSSVASSTQFSVTVGLPSLQLVVVGGSSISQLASDAFALEATLYVNGQASTDASFSWSCEANIEASRLNGVADPQCVTLPNTLGRVLAVPAQSYTGKEGHALDWTVTATVGSRTLSMKQTLQLTAEPVLQSFSLRVASPTIGGAIIPSSTVVLELQLPSGAPEPAAGSYKWTSPTLGSPATLADRWDGPTLVLKPNSLSEAFPQFCLEIPGYERACIALQVPVAPSGDFSCAVTTAQSAVDLASINSPVRCTLTRVNVPLKDIRLGLREVGTAPASLTDATFLNSLIVVEVREGSDQDFVSLNVPQGSWEVYAVLTSSAGALGVLRSSVTNTLNPAISNVNAAIMNMLGTINGAAGRGLLTTLGGASVSRRLSTDTLLSAFGGRRMQSLSFDFPAILTVLSATVDAALSSALAPAEVSAYIQSFTSVVDAALEHSVVVTEADALSYSNSLTRFLNAVGHLRRGSSTGSYRPPAASYAALVDRINDFVVPAGAAAAAIASARSLLLWEISQTLFASEELATSSTSTSTLLGRLDASSFPSASFQFAQGSFSSVSLTSAATAPSDVSNDFVLSMLLQLQPPLSGSAATSAISASTNTPNVFSSFLSRPLTVTTMLDGQEFSPEAHGQTIAQIHYTHSSPCSSIDGVFAGRYLDPVSGLWRSEGIFARAVPAQDPSKCDVTLSTTHFTDFAVVVAPYAEVRLTSSDSSFAIGETGAPGGLPTSRTLSVHLSMAPTADVRVDISTAAGLCYSPTQGFGELCFAGGACTQPDATCQSLVASVEPAFLVFTPSTFGTPQSFTVTAVDDKVADPDITATLALVPTSTDLKWDHNGYCALTDITGECVERVANLGITRGLTVKNADQPGFNVVGTGLALTEPQSAPATISVALVSRPLANVQLTPVVAGLNGRIEVLPTLLLFTPLNFDTPQLVSLTVIDDDIAMGPLSHTLQFSVASADADYQALTAPSVAVTLTDDDVAQVSHSQVGSQLLESGLQGSSIQLSFQLSSEPVGDIHIDFTWTLTAENPGTAATANPFELLATGAIAPSTTVTIAASEWREPLIVTVLPHRDGVHTGECTVELIAQVRVANSADSAYAALAPIPFGFTVLDADIPAWHLQQAVAVVGMGGQFTYSVRLNSAPLSEVVLTPHLSNPNEAEGFPLPFSVFPASHTFDASNYADLATFTVSAAVSAHVFPNSSFSIDHTVITSDPVYSALSLGAVPVYLLQTIQTALQLGEASVILREDTPSSLSFDTVLALSSLPIRSAAISSAWMAPEDALGPFLLPHASSLESNLITLEPAAYSIGAPVAFSAFDDCTAFPNRTYRVEFTVVAGDDNYLGRRAFLSLNYTDSDPFGVSVQHATSVLVPSHGHGQKTVSISLFSRPQRPVTLQFVSSTSRLELPVNQLTFQPDDFPCENGVLSSSALVQQLMFVQSAPTLQNGIPVPRGAGVARIDVVVASADPVYNGLSLSFQLSYASDAVPSISSTPTPSRTPPPSQSAQTSSSVSPSASPSTSIRPVLPTATSTAATVPTVAVLTYSISGVDPAQLVLSSSLRTIFAHSFRQVLAGLSSPILLAAEEVSVTVSEGLSPGRMLAVGGTAQVVISVQQPSQHAARTVALAGSAPAFLLQLQEALVRADADLGLGGVFTNAQLQLLANVVLPSNPPKPAQPSETLDTGATIGIAVASAVVAFVLVGAVIVVVSNRRVRAMQSSALVLKSATFAPAIPEDSEDSLHPDSLDMSTVTLPHSSGVRLSITEASRFALEDCKEDYKDDLEDFTDVKGSEDDSSEHPRAAVDAGVILTPGTAANAIRVPGGATRDGGNDHVSSSDARVLFHSVSL